MEEIKDDKECRKKTIMKRKRRLLPDALHLKGIIYRLGTVKLFPCLTN
jgi:hypothetical protein